MQQSLPCFLPLDDKHCGPSGGLFDSPYAPSVNWHPLDPITFICWLSSNSKGRGASRDLGDSQTQATFAQLRGLKPRGTGGFVQSSACRQKTKQGDPTGQKELGFQVHPSLWPWTVLDISALEISSSRVELQSVPPRVKWRSDDNVENTL